MSKEGDDYTIKGVILDKETSKPLPNLIVRAFDADRLSEDDFLGEGITDDKGKFTIQYHEDDFGKDFSESLFKCGPAAVLNMQLYYDYARWFIGLFEGGPDIVLKIYDNLKKPPLHITEKRSGASRFEEFLIELNIPTIQQGETTIHGFAKTRLAGALSRVQIAFEKAGIRNVRDLRQIARDPASLRELGIAEGDVETFKSFADMCRVFSSNVAVALLDAGASTLKDFEGWTEEKFTQALSDAGSTRSILNVEVERFKLLRTRLKNGALADQVTGIELDIDDSASLTNNDKKILENLGVETLEDWVTTRNDVHLTKNASKSLDAHARLNAVGIKGEIATILIMDNIYSAYDLACLDQPLASKIASRINIKIEVLWDAVQQARKQLYQVGQVLNDTRAARKSSVPSWMNTLPFNGYDSPCSLCPENISAFSRFAYFIYLVQLTGDTLEALEQRFHQKLSELSPESGEEETKTNQINLCIEVLSDAYPGPLSDDENMPFARRMIGCGVTLLTMPLDEFAELVSEEIPGTNAQDLEERLQESRSAPLNAEEPMFTPAEIHTLEFSLMRLLLEPILVKVQEELPNNSPEEQLSEANRRLEEYLKPFYLEALPARRQVYKNRSGKSDRQLYETFFIETNLGVCEKITRLDQAIRSLQGYLGNLFDTAATQEDRAMYEYIDYNPWRADKMSEIYPELKAYWRDDVLTYEDGSWDRGSIIANRSTNREKLREMLKNAHEAIENARISNGRPAQDFVSDPNLIENPSYDSNATSDFFSYPYFDYMKQGLAVIEDVFHADDAIHEATTHMDQDQPGLAIVKLKNALRMLENMATKVFPAGSSSRNIEQCGYKALSDLVPMHRRLQLNQLGSEMIGEPKAIFVSPADPNLVILSEHFRDGLVISPSVFLLGEGFNVSSGNVVKNATSNDSHDTNKRRFCIYTHGAELEDYSCSVWINVDEGLAFVDGNAYSTSGEEIGLAVRGSSDLRTRYQFAVRSRVITVEFDDYRGHELRFDLHLERVYRGEVVSSEKKEEISNPEGSNCQLRLLVDRHGENVLVKGMYFDGTNSTWLQLEDSEPLPNGTFAIVASKTVGARFGSLNINLHGHLENEIPPFYAFRRKELIDQGYSRHYLTSSELLYQARLDHFQGMATNLTEPPISYLAKGVRTEKLVGIRTPEVRERYLLFRDGDYAVSLDALDLLLDRCLSLSFYQRFAAIPIRMAQACLLSGDYEHAIKYMHLVYDESAPDWPTIITNPTQEAQVMYPGFVSAPESFIQTIGADSRLALLRLADIYLPWAEWLFRKNTPETSHKARKIYEKVLKLHGMDEPCKCMEPLGELIESLLQEIYEVTKPEPEIPRHDSEPLTDTLRKLERMPFGRQMPPGVFEVIKNMVDKGLEPDNGNGPIQIADLFQSVNRRLNEAMDSSKTAIRTEMKFEALLEKASILIQEAELRYASQISFDPLQHVRYFVRTPPGVMFGAPIISLWGAVPGPNLYGFTMTFEYYDMVNHTLCVPTNPIKVRQIDQACMMLRLLRHCLNILGFPESIIPPWRFEALLRISQNFTQLAFTSERDLLNFRESFEQDSYSLIQATNHLVLQDADVELEEHNLDLALGDIVLAGLQQRQVQYTIQHYQDIIAGGLSQWEKDALTNAESAITFHRLAAMLQGFQIPLSVALSFINPTSLLSTVGGAASSASSLTAAESAASQYYMTQSGFERREQEWVYQLGQNQLAAQTAAQNLIQAGNRYRFAMERREIAKLRRSIASDAVQFLSHKFLNGAMWSWMQKTIREQYRSRLNFSIAAAYMAERSLAFEIQDRSLQIIRFDYFNPKRDGLLGATQLQTDLTVLENTKLAHSQRKLQISKTISLSAAQPAEFYAFRSRGARLLFGTPMEWFDRDYPGHYMRLIKSVRVSVIALVPPHEGIHATLTNSGISRVVVGPPFSDEFQERIVRRNQESVALSSPYNASGLFVLDYREDLLLPFEGSGVATDWIFELPKSTNNFDFLTIADVLVTIEYTALQSDEYRSEVINCMDRALSADRAYSFLNNFVDQWYYLNNPEQCEPPMAVSFNTRRDDFPANLEELEIQHLALYFVMKDGEYFQEEVELLYSVESDIFWTDYQVNVSIRSDDDDTIGIMFRVKDSKNYYRFSWDKQRSYRRLVKREDDTFTLLAEDSEPYERGRWYQLEILVQESTIEVKIDNNQIFSVNDTTLSHGSIALYSWGNIGSYFRNITVKDISVSEALPVVLEGTFDNADRLGWRVVDEGNIEGPSAWSVANGEVVQSSNIHSAPVDDGTDKRKLGTYALWAPAVTVGGRATPADSIISTRQGSAQRWMGIIGKSPFSTWRIALPKTENVRNIFKDRKIEDILFVINYSGQKSEWQI